MKVARILQPRPDSDTHTITITLTTADVKDIFLHVRELLNKSLGWDYSPTFTKNDLLFTIHKHFSVFGDYAKNLEEWALQVAIRNEFIYKISDIGYKVNPTIMELKPGKTAKKVAEFLRK